MPETEQRFQKRQTAYKIRIKDILDSKYIKAEGFKPNYLEVYGQEISRINVIGVVVQKAETNNYKTVNIDDGSGRISSRYFEDSILSHEIDVGNVVLIIGRPREFSSEKYILIESIKKIDTVWAKVRKLELEEDAIKGYTSSSTNNTIEKEIVPGPTNKIVEFIKELDKGSGVSIEELSSKNIKDVDKIIDVLLKNGDIFEIKPGKLKVLE